MKEISSENHQLFKTITGKHIRKLRQELGQTIAECAWKMEIDAKHLGEIERGKRDHSLFIFMKAQKGLGLNYYDVLEEYTKALQAKDQRD